MKKLIALMLVIAFVFTLSACNDKNTASNPDTNVSTGSETFVKPENYASVLLVCINPQFKLYLDENNNVLAVEPVNEDAKSFSKSIDFKNKSIETVIGNIVEQASENGFIKENVTVNFEIAEQKEEINNSDILSKAVSAANKKATELKIEIKAEIKENDNSQTTETNSENTQTDKISKPTTSSKTEETTKKEESSSKPTTTTKPTESSKPTHTHNFSAATCTEPQKCSCGATQGAALSHNFKDGVCTSCDSEDPNYEPSYTSINNKNGVWCAMIMQGTKIYETTFSLFDEMYISQPIWDEFSTIPEEMHQEIRDDVDNNSFYKVYNGKEYYCGSGNDWDVAELIINGNTIILNIVEKYAPSNAPSAKIVLNRIDENTIIVKSVTENYSKGIDILVDIKFVFSAKQ